MPTDVETSLNIWWRGLEPSVELEVRYPHSRHGNAGEIFNSAKTSVMQDVLEFVDINSQPNGRLILQALHIFCLSLLPFRCQKNDVFNYEECLQRSVVGEFNCAQRKRSRGECSNSSHNWLKQRPKVAICPHQTIVTHARKETWKSMVHRRHLIAYSSPVMQIQRRSRKRMRFLPSSNL